jgi:glucose dehydrogenase
LGISHWFSFQKAVIRKTVLQTAFLSFPQSHKSNEAINSKPNQVRFSSRFLRFAALFCAVFSAQIACTNNGNETSADNQAAPQTQLPTGANSAPEAEDGQWLMAAKNYASTRFSGLDQINASNVGNLKVAWTFSTGVNRGQEAAPLIVGDTMYVVTPYPNILYALDLKASGATKWKYEPKPGLKPLTRKQEIFCGNLKRVRGLSGNL